MVEIKTYCTTGEICGIMFPRWHIGKCHSSISEVVKRLRQDFTRLV